MQRKRGAKSMDSRKKVIHPDDLSLPFVLMALLLAWPLANGCKKKPPPPPLPPEVRILTATPTNVPIFEEWIGTLDGSVNAQIRAQVSGYLMTQNYREGASVKKGDLLFEIDPRPLQAALEQTRAKLAQDKAQVIKTEQDVKRFTPLAKEQAISQQELDNAIQANAGAKAQVKADEALVDAARLNLSFTKVISPIDGVAGTALVQIGDLAGPSGSVLTTVSTLDPIKVYFQASEQSYLHFFRKLATGAESQPLGLQLILSDNSVYPEKGKFFYADRQINPNTGTLQIAGTFPNPDFVLRPGQYGRIRAQTQTRTNIIVVPQRAVTEMQGTYQVVVVDEQNKAHVKPVTIGPQVGARWIIEKGLQPGDRVVVEGTQKAKEGVVVNPQPFTPVKDQTKTIESTTSSAEAANPSK
jgi:RND family efflux transporter MFP subunit